MHMFKHRLLRACAGFIIGLFPARGTGYSPEGYSWALGIFLAAQLLAFGWYVAASPHKEKRA